MQMRRVPSSGWRGYTTLVLSADGGADRVLEYGYNKTVEEEEEDEVKVTSLKQDFFFFKKEEGPPLCWKLGGCGEGSAVVNKVNKVHLLAEFDTYSETLLGDRSVFLSSTQ